MTSRLADIYDLDMGARTEDLESWICLLGKARLIAEVGCGTGRVPMGLALRGWSCARWVGIDPDPVMIRRFADRTPSWTSSVQGDALERGTWAMARALVSGAFDAVVIPYSALFLVPHERQVDLLRLAGGSIRSGGFVAAEVFCPQWTDTREVAGTRPCRGSSPLEPWNVHYRYHIDGSSRTTRVCRGYGPAGHQPHISVEEHLWWRLPNELPALAHDAGLDSPMVVQSHPVAHGFVILAARV